MSLNRFFCYFGAKHQIGPRYPPPRHETIVEPFAGSAGYATRHFRCRVILIEKNPIIARVWRYLLAATPRQLLALPDVHAGQSLSELAVSEAERDLIGLWVDDTNVRPRERGSRRALVAHASGMHHYWGRTIRGQLAGQVDKIRHWTIIEGDYTAAPDVEATWFVDPPYEELGSLYPESAANIDFAKLGAWCRLRRGQVMVCENEGATWLPFRKFTQMKGDRPEVLWTNDTEAPSAEMR